MSFPFPPRSSWKHSSPTKFSWNTYKQDERERLEKKSDPEYTNGEIVNKITNVFQINSS